MASQAMLTGRRRWSHGGCLVRSWPFVPERLTVVCRAGCPPRHTINQRRPKQAVAHVVSHPGAPINLSRPAVTCGDWTVDAVSYDL